MGEELGKIKRLGFKHMKTKSSLDAIPFRNKQIDNVKNAYERQTKKDEGVNIGENKMFTGNAWFDIGLSLGRKAKAKGGK